MAAADTVADVVVPAATWTDLYAGSGVAVGTAVTVYNNGSDSVRIARKATAPGSLMGVPIFVGENGIPLVVPGTVTGLWAYSVKGTSVSVQA